MKTFGLQDFRNTPPAAIPIPIPAPAAATPPAPGLFAMSFNSSFDDNLDGDQNMQEFNMEQAG